MPPSWIFLRAVRTQHILCDAGVESGISALGRGSDPELCPDFPCPGNPPLALDSAGEGSDVSVGQSRAVTAAGHREAFWWLQPLQSEPSLPCACRKAASPGLHELWGDYLALHSHPCLPHRLTESVCQPCPPPADPFREGFPKTNAPTPLLF